MSPLLQRVKLAAGRHYRRSPLFRLRNPRRIHVYGIGGPKTGTHSIAGLFETHYRAEHQAWPKEAADAIVEHSAGRLSREDFRRGILRRDTLLWLEADVSFLNAHFADVLAEAHPEAKFILTVREPRSWLCSMINQLMWLREMPHEETWHRLAGLHLGGSGDFPPAESILREHRLFPLAQILAQWRDHIERCLAAVPPGRLLIVRTEQIAARVRDIEAFCGAAPGALPEGNAHLFRSPKSYDVFERLDPVHVDVCVREVCGGTLERLARRPSSGGE